MDGWMVMIYLWMDNFCNWDPKNFYLAAFDIKRTGPWTPYSRTAPPHIIMSLSISDNTYTPSLCLFIFFFGGYYFYSKSRPQAGPNPLTYQLSPTTVEVELISSP